MPCQEASGVWVVEPYLNKCSVRSTRVWHPSIQAFGAITIALYAGGHNSRHSALVPSNTIVAFVHEGTRAPSVWSQRQGQIYLGLRAFIEKMQKLVDKKPSLTEIPRAQRRAAKRALAEFASTHERKEAIALAYLSGQHTMAAIATRFGVHYTTVSRLVKAYEADQKV